MTACCKHKFEMCIIQRSDAPYTFTDVSTADYTGATQIKFRVRQSRGASLLFEHTLTAGGVTLAADNKIAVTISAAQSALLTGNRAYAEIWATLADGSKRGTTGTIKITPTDGDA